MKLGKTTNIRIIKVASENIWQSIEYITIHKVRGDMLKPIQAKTWDLLEPIDNMAWLIIK